MSTPPKASLQVLGVRLYYWQRRCDQEREYARLELEKLLNADYLASPRLVSPRSEARALNKKLTHLVEVFGVLIARIEEAQRLRAEINSTDLDLNDSLVAESAERCRPSLEEMDLILNKGST